MRLTEAGGEDDGQCSGQLDGEAAAVGDHDTLGAVQAHDVPAVGGQARNNAHTAKGEHPGGHLHLGAGHGGVLPGVVHAGEGLQSGGEGGSQGERNQGAGEGERCAGWEELARGLTSPPAQTL